MAGTYVRRGASVRFRYTSKSSPKPIYETVHGFTGKRDIQRKLGAWVQDIESGEYQRRKAREAAPTYFRTARAFFENWLNQQAKRRSWKTVHRYGQLTTRYILPVVGELKVEDVRPAHCQQVVTDMERAGLMPRTIIQAHRVMTAAFNHAVRVEIRPDNPAGSRKVLLPSPADPKLRVPSPKEVRAIIEAASDGPHIGPIYIAAHTGLRLGEVGGLRWRSIDLDSATIRVTDTIKEEAGRLAFGAPKTDRARREVPLPPEAVDFLRRIRSEQARRRLLIGAEWGDHDLAFDAGDGGPVSPEVLSRYFGRLMDRLGGDFPAIRFHDLRHAYATTLFRRGVSVKDVSAMLGHASEAFTMRVYIDHVPEAALGVVREAITGAFS